MFEKIIKLTGKKEGPTSIVLAGVHGDERCGIDALKKILPNILIEKGTVLFGYGNPRAIEANKRFTESNLNRLFKDDDLLLEAERNSYEYKRAQFLKNYLNQADALLDIHANLTPNSKPFVVCEANAKEIVERLPIDLVVSGFDHIQPGGTDYYMNTIGKIGICVECGYINDPQSTQIAEKNIIAFLKTRGHIKNGLKPQNQSHIRIHDMYKIKTNSFTLVKAFNDFEEILKGQTIGIDGGEKVKAERRCVILFARNREQIGDEAFLLGGKKNSLV